MRRAGIALATVLALTGPGRIGDNGFSANRREGDGTTPADNRWVTRH